MLAPGGTFNLLLLTLHSSFNNASQVGLETCDEVCGATAFTPAPDYLPIADVALHVVPEPTGVAALALAAIAGLGALRTARRRLA